mmetsp:Transcript_3852/g.11181  ORF Transcript_3852/g.11181 Transcript_3852/m.11181 type:complete len:344 (+) Transcript_3852:739-1770(+)
MDASPPKCLRERVSGSSGAGVTRSPDSQQWPTMTYSPPAALVAESAAWWCTSTAGCCAPYSEGRRSSVMPESSLRKVWPSAPVVAMSCTVETRQPEFATRNVPGSISRSSWRPVRAANSSKAPLTGSPTTARSVDASCAMRPTLYPPPRLSEATVGIFSQRASERPETRCHTAGSEPEPMCVCTRAGARSCSSTSACTSGRSSCQMPNEEDGPPTFVFPVPPEPSPGLNRTPSCVERSPRLSRPYSASWRSEHALNLIPRSSSSARSAGVSCEEREMRLGATPAATARRTSYPEEASTCRPSRSKVCSTAAFGHAFMAKRTVRPYALGKASAVSACDLSAASE